MKYFFISLMIFIPILLLSQETDFQKTKALKGEGIHALLRRFDMDSSHYLKEFIKLNKEIIGENDWLTEGNEYLLPKKLHSKKEIEAAISEDKFVIVDLLGEQYKKVMIVDNKLEGAIFYLISGHGGPDPGAIGTRNNQILCEDEYAYDVSIRLYRNLISHGATVYMVIQDSNDGIRDEEILQCDKDEYCMNNEKEHIPIDQLKRLKQRTNEINKISKHISNDVYERAIIIHCDSRSEGTRIDVFFYHFSKSPKGKSLAYSILNTFDKKYGEHQPNRGYKGTVSTRSLYIINNTRPPAIYIELGNIRNNADQIRFIKENNRQALANWMTEGIINDAETYKKK